MKFLNMERRQKYIEEVLKKQQKHIFRISKELEIHREFLNLQFESFMDYLFQNGGQIIQLPSKNGRAEETGVFFPMKKDKLNGEVKPEEDNERQDDTTEGKEDGEDKDLQQTEEEDEGDREDIMEELPPPQAILGSPSAEDMEENNHHVPKKSVHDGEQFRGQSSSRRSSHNVVSSSVAQNGDDDEYDELEEYDSAQPEVMKYDMNHFMFSHFMDGNGEDNEMDDSYNDNDEDGYDNEDVMDLVDQRRSLGSNRQQWSHNNLGRNISSGNMQQMAGKSSSNNLPVPASNMPHNERTCRYCGKTFHWKQSWVIHERTHTGEKPYLCSCGKAFSQKSNMNTHAKSCSQAMTTTKGKTTVFQMKCSHCQKMFTHKKNLDLHMEKFHGEILNLSVKASSSSSSPSSSFHLNGSAMMEAELAAAAARAAENAAILQILKTAANSQVTTNNSLKTTHSGSLSPSINHNSNSNSSMSGGDDRNGRYPCPYCPKRFPVKGTLERHLRVHTGEKPFQCGVCGKAFTQKGSVKLHLERVHRQTC